MNIAVLISGRGSNLQALIHACQQPDFPARIVVVIASRPDAPGIKIAEQAALTCHTVSRREFSDRGDFEKELHAKLVDAHVDLVCLAGFSWLLTASFIMRWYDKIINIHPSLLPAFKGLGIHQSVIESGVKFSGCTVHYVRPEVDSGPIIVQAVVPVYDHDDRHSLSERILEQEHALYPLAVRLIAENRVVIKGNRTLITDEKKA